MTDQDIEKIAIKVAEIIIQKFKDEQRELAVRFAEEIWDTDYVSKHKDVADKMMGWS